MRLVKKARVTHARFHIWRHRNGEIMVDTLTGRYADISEKDAVKFARDFARETYRALKAFAEKQKEEQT